MKKKRKKAEKKRMDRKIVIDLINSSQFGQVGQFGQFGQFEVDKHFPHLTVGETLEFAASVRTPQQRLVDGTTRKSWAKHMTKVVMAVFGLSHTYNTKVGNDFLDLPIAAWDNSTRGLDAATALEKENFDFVEDVIKMLNMEDFSEAVVGVLGEGLNVEQRKLLTIGVELAAKPALLLFLDEPTSGRQMNWRTSNELSR
ncbi:hypothetical protein SS1G_02313 [Sclerotinia sclerotiorum 1980 UF-70]|uniref:ABC transporter domain-containing protein n=1 Tax=Sclerotinia sclerotiorum (strain ATCC 18683 / 1980 / Ss-1) TaxID=665079 RepID=A7EAI1_SCLS1|nr:hypothetical protein SS1G_02313 [Sclerotinia sclerotiorum 1980 UF-70]EDN99459.1 hypothetical protein SS1G_02313 [Sclerotinia sclerotiorum 1980 UF-70]